MIFESPTAPVRSLLSRTPAILNFVSMIGRIWSFYYFDNRHRGFQPVCLTVLEIARLCTGKLSMPIELPAVALSQKCLELLPEYLAIRERFLFLSEVTLSEN